MFQVNMATGCQVRDCQRLASAFCFCCKNNVCTSHFLGHIERVTAKIDSLANGVNNTMERIQNLTVDQLNQWRMEMHELIDDIHRSKTKEIVELLNKTKEIFDEHKRKQSEAMIRLQEGVKQLVEDGDVTLEQIESFENQLRQIEKNTNSFEKNFLAFHTRVLPVGLVTVSCKIREAHEPIPTTKFKQPSMLGKFPAHRIVVRRFDGRICFRDVVF